MKRETFFKLLQSVRDTDTVMCKLDDLGIDVYESTFATTVSEVFDTVIGDVYGSEGLEWAQWWVYEKCVNPELKAYDTAEDGSSVEILKTQDELYEYLESNHKQD